MTRKLNVIWEPNPGPQTAFLTSTARECLYGGAAGGGKTDALMMLPFYRKDNPKHRSIMFRRTRPQLQEVIDRQQQLYPLIEPNAKWQEDKSRWVWPSGAITQMGYMEHEQDRLKFKTFEFDMVLFDELTSFTEKMYLFLFSRNRTKDAAMPPVMRGGTNPGDVGHQWVYDRFISNREPYMEYEEAIDARDVQGIEGLEGLTTTMQFIPARLSDNPKMPDRQAYVAGLKIMGEEGDAYLAGDWATFSGQMFRTPLVTGPALPWTPGSFIVRSFDYGWADPLVVMWVRVHPDNTHEILREVYTPELTVQQIAHIVNSVENDLKIRPMFSVGGHDMFNSEGTSGGQSIANMLTSRGIWLEKANNDRVGGWAKVQELLTARKLYVRQGMAPNLVRTLPNLVRNPDKPQDVKGKQEDHAAECLRYAVMAVPERAITGVTGYLPPQQVVTERDPVFARIMAELQNGRESVIFPGLEG